VVVGAWIDERHDGGDKTYKYEYTAHAGLQVPYRLRLLAKELSPAGKTIADS